MDGLSDECWAITDRAAGNQRQALALAGKLGLPVRHLVLEPMPPWSWLSPRLVGGGEWALPPAQRAAFVPPWPCVAIGCGRRAALFTRLLRTLACGRCHTVQILDPRIDPAHWDTLIAPRHDDLRGENVLNPLGSLNPVDDGWLADARESCPQFADLPQPRTVLLLGGPRHGIVIDAGYARALATHLRAQWQRDGGSLLLLGSRRTPTAVMDEARRLLDGIPGLCWSGPADGGNPYPGALGWADRLVVTPDSVNMLSEACATGRPVQTFAPVALPAKLARFHHALREAGLLHDLTDTAPPPPQPPLRETAAIAELLLRRIRMHQGG